jgi:hypothetical protein
MKTPFGSWTPLATRPYLPLIPGISMLQPLRTACVVQRQITATVEGGECIEGGPGVALYLSLSLSRPLHFSLYLLHSPCPIVLKRKTRKLA